MKTNNIDNLVNYLLDHNWKQIPLKRDYGVYAFRSENESGKCSVFIPKSKDIDKYERELLSNLIKICERDDLHLGTFIDYLIKDHSPIYTITCMEKFEEKIFEDGRSSGFPTYGSTAFMGFYHDFNDAAKNQKAINDVATISKFPSSDALDAFPNRIPTIRRIGATISRTIMPITYGASFRFRGFASLFLP